ncbi:TPA: hypothetical protein CPT89_01205 [Candidatus Gastranaerophilales bacterium HUM_11]|nr:MAG TPA: hypothetical protein CPT89_01205 [Candidatus Gastranaerophilales bacterium HUM_11]DAX39345.1 MAG TPA: hypothetical protein [Caudoviricetes sp.]
MIACQQKYCKHCIKPRFDSEGKFRFGWCKISKTLVLHSDKEGTMKLDVQPLYCYRYEPRKRKIKY